MKKNELYTLGIDIGSTTVKIAVLGADNEVLFSDYERHFAKRWKPQSLPVQTEHAGGWQESALRIR